MKLDRAGRFAMLPRTLLELPGERPLDVACAEGTLWLTLDDDPRDLVLEPGERVRIESDRRVLAYAMGASVMEVSQPAEAPPLRAPARPRFAFA